MQVSFLLKHLILCLCLQVITSETMNSVGISELQLPITRQGRRRRRRRRNRKLLLIESDSSSMSRQKDKSLLEYQLPRRSVTTTSAFGTDRLVPTGPNPLHNSNTTQIWYPWYWNHQHLLMYRRPGVSLLIWKEKHTLHGHFLLLLSTSHIFLVPKTLIQIWQLWWQCNWWSDIIWSSSPSVPSCKLLVNSKDEKIVRKSFPMYEYEWTQFWIVDLLQEGCSSFLGYDLDYLYISIWTKRRQ
jgi:hypothetical protein